MQVTTHPVVCASAFAKDFAQWRSAIKTGNRAYEHFGYPDEQALQLCAVHEKLCQAMDDPNLDESWRSAALRHSRRTYAELTRLVRHHPRHARAHAALALGAAGPLSALRVQ